MILPSWSWKRRLTCQNTPQLALHQQIKTTLEKLLQFMVGAAKKIILVTVSNPCLLAAPFWRKQLKQSSVTRSVKSALAAFHAVMNLELQLCALHQCRALSRMICFAVTTKGQIPARVIVEAHSQWKKATNTHWLASSAGVSAVLGSVFTRSSCVARMGFHIQ